MDGVLTGAAFLFAMWLPQAYFCLRRIAVSIERIDRNLDRLVEKP